jgi:hypothetical protein
MQQRIFEAMRIVRENSTSAIVKIAGNACAADVFVVRTLNERRIAHLDATHRYKLKALGADSESRILAMKKFSCAEPSRLIGARQNRFFARIAKTDSRTVSGPREPSLDVADGSRRARAREAAVRDASP